MFRYLINLFTKKEPFGEKSNSYAKAMHNINRIAVVLFILSLIIMALKFFF